MISVNWTTILLMNAQFYTILRNHKTPHLIKPCSSTYIIASERFTMKSLQKLACHARRNFQDSSTSQRPSFQGGSQGFGDSMVVSRRFTVGPTLGDGFAGNKSDDLGCLKWNDLGYRHFRKLSFVQISVSCHYVLWWHEPCAKINTEKHSLVKSDNDVLVKHDQQLFLWMNSNLIWQHLAKSLPKNTVPLFMG